MSMDIYKITNQVNGKVYIGQSINIKHRWIQHKSDALNNRSDAPIHRAIRKYGIQNFSFEIIEECEQERMNEKEIYWIKYYDSTNKKKGYNIKLGGESAGTIYNYKEIYNQWLKGYTCKEIQDFLSCDDAVITAALRAHGISEYETKSRSLNKNKFVALSKDDKPLKIFEGMKDVSLYFTKEESKADNLTYRIIPNHYVLFGYYWDYLNDNNIPDKELTDEEFYLIRCLIYFIGRRLRNRKFLKDKEQ